MEIIHIVLGKANPDRLNGVNKVVYQMASEQTKAGKKVQVWGITANPIPDYPERNFKTRLFQAARFPFAVDKTLKQAIIEHKEKAVFHLHGGWIPVFGSLSGIFSRHRIKYVLTPHGAYNEVAMLRSKFTKKIYFLLFEKHLLKNVHKVHSIGASEVKGLGKLSPTAHSFLLPYGFNYNYNATIIPKRSFSENEAFIIGFVGRLDVYTKGLDLLMAAFETFQKKQPAARLWIIGDGEGKAYLENFIKEKKLNNVILWGKKFGQEKDELISQMHLFSHPSRNEGLPTAVLEAAVFGVPVIVTPATNVAEYVSHFGCGIAVADNNETELVRAIQQIYDDYASTDKAVLYAEGAKKMLSEMFSWHILVDKYDDLYQ